MASIIQGLIIIIILSDTSASYTYLRSDFYMFIPIVGKCGDLFVIELSHIWTINSNDCEKWKIAYLSSGLFG